MTAAIMIVGTASGVGKSTLVTGLCRVFRQQGLRVAPFKAQNISDRVHCLPDGKKIARSSALAALACGLAPETDMNPILMIPSTATGLCVFLNGEAVPAADLAALTPSLFDQAFAAYTRLRNRYDLIVIEGAGSPVELNLLDRDIVNMRFALRAQAPVILVGEVNRGGVFASVYGTLSLMPDEQRAMVKGLVINKFMGDPALFADGRQIMEQISERPVLGVLPYVDIRLEDEDSFAEGPAKTPDHLSCLQHQTGSTQNYDDVIEAALDDLARHLTPHLDIEAILALARQGVPA